MITYEFVRSSFENEEYELLSTEYVSAKTQLHYICPNGHSGTINWNNWHSGSRCLQCSRTTKVLYEDIKHQFEKEGYILLSNGYINAKSLLYYICPVGHSHHITFNNWLQGRRCYYCYKQSIALDIDQIRSLFVEEGFTLLSSSYTNAHTKLNYICPNGHEHSMTLNKWKYGRRCPTCANINMCGSGNPSWKGGISFEPYCEAWKDIEYKKYIRNRDSNRCLNPYCNSNNKNDLTIHHIDYDKKNCSPKNLITICRSCNVKANSDRDWHKEWYKTILTNRYNY